MTKNNIFPRVVRAGIETDFRIDGTNGKIALRLVYKNSGEVLLASDSPEIRTTLPYFGEYYIYISSAGSADCRISLFAVDEKLAGLKPLRGDLHIHTLYSDGAQSPKEMVLRAFELGLDYIAITDHDSYFPSIEAQAFADISGVDILVFSGEEVTVPTGGHVLSINADSPLHLKDMDVDELNKLIQIEADNIDSGDLVNGLDSYTYGGLKLVMRQIKEKGGFSVLCHPFWMVEHTGFYHLPRPMLIQAVKDRLPDALEIPGDTLHQDNMLGLSFYHGCTDQSIPIVSNSDTHSTEHTFGQRWQICFVKEKSADNILNAISSFMSVACEISGENTNVYGSFELVEYAYFLIREYFPTNNDSYFFDTTMF